MNKWKTSTFLSCNTTTILSFIFSLYLFSHHRERHSKSSSVIVTKKKIVKNIQNCKNLNSYSLPFTTITVEKRFCMSLTHFTSLTLCFIVNNFFYFILLSGVSVPLEKLHELIVQLSFSLYKKVLFYFKTPFFPQLSHFLLPRLKLK